MPDPLDVENELMKANADPRVHGIIVYYPIFGQQKSYSGEGQDDYLRDSIHPTKGMGIVFLHFRVHGCKFVAIIRLFLMNRCGGALPCVQD